jgi:hypothetical protein
LFNETNTYNVIFTGWSHVPASWEKYGELVYQWVKHEVDLRGEDEVNSWYWEVWNEVSLRSSDSSLLSNKKPAKYRLLERNAGPILHIVRPRRSQRPPSTSNSTSRWP